MFFKWFKFVINRLETLMTAFQPQRQNRLNLIYSVFRRLSKILFIIIRTVSTMLSPRLSTVVITYQSGGFIITFNHTPTIYIVHTP